MTEENKDNFKQTGRTITMDGEEYYIPTKQGYAISDTVSKLWEDLGKPPTPFSDAGEKLMDVIIATWEDTFPNHYREWVKERKEVERSQLSTKEQVKQKTGRNLAAYPMYVYKMVKLVFPNFEFTKRENQIKLVKKWPIFRLVEKV